MTNKIFTAIGVISGTSMDGIDVSIIRSDGYNHVECGAYQSYPYSHALKKRLFDAMGCVPTPGVVFNQLQTDVTRAHADAINQFIDDCDIDRGTVDMIGFHGQTVFHDPDNRRTCQLGDGALMAAQTGIHTVFNFRGNDVKAGGQGAPLAPIYHAALCGDITKPVAVLNIGGVANVTFVGNDGEDIMAFDTGPGNALIDDWMRRHTDHDCDMDGRFAAAGHVDTNILNTLLSHPYFNVAPPKSLDRDHFQTREVNRLSVNDGAATLTAYTVETITRAFEHAPSTPATCIVCGGGRHNPTMMAMLSDRLGIAVKNADEMQWNGDAVEAECFAYLAIRHVLGLPISFPKTTGVKTPFKGGQYAAAHSQERMLKA